MYKPTERITSIEFDGIMAVCHVRVTKQVVTATKDRDGFKWLHDRGFRQVCHIGSGYALALHDDGMWYRVDLREQKVQGVPKPVSEIPSDILQSKFVSPEEWGKWATEIPVIRKVKK